MNILHLDQGREMRGGQLQVTALMRGLRDSGHSVALLARSGSPLLEKARAENLEAQPFTLISLSRALRRADVAHAHDARSHLFAACFSAVFSSKPLVVSRRVAFPLHRGPFSRWKYSRATAFAAVSLAAAHHLIIAGVDSSRIRVIHDGVPLLPESWSAAGPVVIPNGKRVELALEAARLAGAPVLCSKGDLQRDLRGASLLVYISDSEGLGSAALLAMSAGIPVVASNVGGLREFVRNGETGVRVENRASVIAEAIRRLRAAPAEARALGMAARRMVQSQFSSERMVTKTLELYREIIHGR